MEIREKIDLRWYQARNDPKSKAGDRAIIDLVSKKSVKTTFLSEGLKAKMLSSTKNPFNNTYSVSVAIESIGGLPVHYRIIDIAL